MVKYLSPEEFKKQFLISDTLLGKGQDGTVYKSGDYAVKLFDNEEGLLIMSKELSCYNLLNHPNIIKPIAWTFDKIGYMALHLGIPIEKAYKDKLVTMKQIVFDTLSGLHYMNYMGIDQNDQCQSNMIFYEGKVKYIDMGSADLCPSVEISVLNLFRSYLKLDGFSDQDIYLPVNDIKFTGYIRSYMISCCDQLTDSPVNRYLRKFSNKEPVEIEERVFRIERKWEEKVEPHLALLKEKYVLSDGVFYIMMSLIKKCDILPNTQLMEYMCMKIAKLFFSCTCGYLECEDAIKEMDNEVTLADCHYTLVTIMRLTQNKILTY